MFVTFQDWTKGRDVVSLGTNAGAPELPFQNWRHFKEAFAPELVARAVEESDVAIQKCIDPFGGSGTTALACQFLGVHPITIEVNPFLADLIESKLVTYDADVLAADFGTLIRALSRRKSGRVFKRSGAPETLVEPGVNNRWIFDTKIAERISAWLWAIDQLPLASHRRLFRVLLGGVLIEASNIVVNGKGRRYRRGWEDRERSPELLDELFTGAAQNAIGEIHRYAKRTCATYDVLRGDCRTTLKKPVPCELAVFSPPYPNSFDYTDVYNIELWTLGYLNGSAANQALRKSTLCSHVQVARAFPSPPTGSGRLDRTLRRLARERSNLWDSKIPEMVGGYFADLLGVIRHIHKCLCRRGSAWMVVGDSRYSGVRIKTAEIVAELAEQNGWKVKALEPWRSMRASAQQGGRYELAETLIVVTKR